MIRDFCLRGHLVPILLASLLGLSTHSLWAQKSPPPEEIHARMFDRPIQLALVPEARAHLGPVPETLPEAPQSQTDSREKLFPISYGQTLVNIQAGLNLQQPAGTAELPGKAKCLTGSTSSQWLTSAYCRVPYPTIHPADHLQYYSHHIPWAGSTILRVSQQAKAHPHVISVLKLLKPKF